MSPDVMEVATKTTHIVFENEKIRVMEGHFKKGQSFAMHSHPANLVYAITDVKFESTRPGGKPEVIELKKGDSQYNDAMSHSVEFQTSGVYLQIEIR